MIRVERFDDARAFFELVAPYLELNEAAHTLHLGMRGRVERDPHVFGARDPRLYAVLSGGEVVGASAQTPPYAAALALFSDEPAIDTLAERMHDDDPSLEGILAEVGQGERFVRRWRALSGGAAEIAVEQRIYQATELVPPRPTSGHARAYEASDRELVIEWMDAFMAEAMAGSPEGDGASFMRRKEADPSGGLMLWEDDDGPVSLAGYGSPSPNGLRVGPVFTPPELRGRGYASAVTAAVTEVVLSRCRFAFLFTDLANPTSNSIYRQIGYQPMLDVTRWAFRPA